MFIEEKVAKLSIPGEAIPERQWETQSIISEGMSGKQQQQQQQNQKTSSPNIKEYGLN